MSVPASDTDTGNSTPVSTPAPTHDYICMFREVLSVPLYLHLPRYVRAQQSHILVHLVLRTNDDGTFIYAAVKCDEIIPPFPRAGPNTTTTVTTPEYTVYIPDDILGNPVYIIVEKLLGIRLKKRLAVQLTFIEWLPGNHATFEVVADIKFIDRPIELVTQRLYMGDVFPGASLV